MTGFDLDKLRFDEKGLIPAIIVDSKTKQVLTLAYIFFRKEI